MATPQQCGPPASPNEIPWSPVHVACPGGPRGAIAMNVTMRIDNNEHPMHLYRREATLYPPKPAGAGGDNLVLTNLFIVLNLHGSAIGAVYGARTIR